MPRPLVPGSPARVARGRLLARYTAMRTVAYFSGLLIILAAFAWGALLLDVPKSWIGVGLLLGLGIILIKGTRYTPHPPR